MAKCINCGSDTDLIINGGPLCLECDKCRNRALRYPIAREESPESSLTACEECGALADQFDAAAESYRKATAHFKDLNGADFQKAWDDSAEPLEARERARHALADHDREHGCLKRATARRHATNAQ